MGALVIVIKVIRLKKTEMTWPITHRPLVRYKPLLEARSFSSSTITESN